jgi:hypothetical protein
MKQVCALPGSAYAEKLVLKGGVLLAAYDTCRPTRETLTGRLSVARLAFHVDVNVGDPIWPAPQKITLPRLLDGQLVLTGFLDGCPALARQRWAAWRRKHRLDDRLPQDLASVLETVMAFADPAITRTAAGHIWDARPAASHLPES